MATLNELKTKIDATYTAYLVIGHGLNSFHVHVNSKSMGYVCSELDGITGEIVTQKGCTLWPDVFNTLPYMPAMSEKWEVM